MENLHLLENIFKTRDKLAIQNHFNTAAEPPLNRITANRLATEK